MSLLDTDVSSIDTSYPRIVAGLYELSISAAEKIRNKAETGDNLKVEFKTTQPATSTTGEPVPPGFTMSRYIGLTVTEKYSEDMIGKTIASLMKCFGVTGSPRTIIDTPAVLIGKIGPCKVSIKKETTEFPEGNEVKSFVVKA